MAKIKRGEKLGEIVGKRHIITGAALVFIGAVLALAMLDYAPGQNIFFKEYFEPFVNSTDTAGNNIFFGKIGATFCIASYLALGWATVMIPVYLLWTGFASFKRSARAVSKGALAASIGGLLLFSILLAALQDAAGASRQTEMLPLGWGGKFGDAVFGALIKPFMNTGGGILLVAPLYFFCLIVVFVDSPLEAAKELGGASKKLPRVFASAAKAVFSLLALPFKMLRNLRGKKDPDAELESALAASPRRSKGAPLPRSARVKEARHIEQEPPESPEEPEEEKSDEEESGDEARAPIDLSQTEISQEPIEDFSGRFDDDEPKGVDLSQTEISENFSDESGEKLETIEISKIEEDDDMDEPPAPPAKTRGDYVFPPLSLLAEPEKDEDLPEEDYNSRITEIVNVIGSFGVKVLPDKAYPGPVITRYEVKPATGVKISRIANLEDDITAGIKAEKVRIIAPVPGRGTVGIEVPNIHRRNVGMREVLQSKQWRENTYELPVALGKDATGVPIVANLKKMTHALIAGSTNSGKSVCIHTIIASMLYKMTPDDLRLIMIDPKMVELQVYNSVPHMLIPVVSDVKKAAAALKWLTAEMMRRYKIFKLSGVRNIDGFNAKILKDKEAMAQAERAFAEMTPEERQAANSANDDTQSATGDESDEEIPDTKLPYIVCIIDELADLMSTVGKDVEQYIARITQLARAAGIHMIIATQRPDVKVITGLIKNNLPTRIAFRVTSQIDSRTILDRKGAESLIGTGDMLFLNNGTSDPVRAQGAFLSDGEIAGIVEFLKQNGEPQYAEDVQSQIDADGDEEDSDFDDGGRYKDPMTAKAIGIIRASGKASASFIQRKLGIGFPRAGKIIDELEELGIIGPDKGQGQRDIHLDKAL